MNTALAITPSIFDFKAANDATHNIRTVNQDGEVWFIAKDVFQTLELSWNGTRSLAIIPKSWIWVVKLTTQSRGDATQMRDLQCINFKAVCKIAFRSNKPEADNFTNWAAEVIETVLKTGRYELTPRKLINTTKTDRIPLKDAVTRLIAVTKMMNYPQAYELVHKAFGVDSITEIPKDKLHVATMYVNGLVGEYIPYEKPKTIEVPKDCVAVKKDQLQRIVHHTSYLSDVVNTLYPLLRGLHSPMAGSLIGHMQEIQCCANILKRQHGLVARITP